MRRPVNCLQGEMLLKTLASLALLSAFALSTSQSFTLDRTIKSAVKDTSNMASSQSTYELNVFKDAADPDFYVNDITLTTGPGWDPDLDIYAASNFGGIFGTGGDFGTRLTGTFFDIFQIGFRYGEVASSVANGIYNFTMQVLGGGSDTSMDILSSHDLQIEVVDGIALGVDGSVTHPEIVQGGTSTARMSVRNTGSRDFITTTWYYAGGGFETSGGGSRLIGNFVGNWFDQTITPGNFRTDDHTTWTAAPDQPVGLYEGNFGVYGGYHMGDQHSFRASATSINVVVPEPGTLIVLGLGAVAALRRRNR